MPYWMVPVRGGTAGQKLRALRRGQEDVGLKLGAQTAIEKAKERKEAQEQIIGLEEAEKGRQQAAGIGAYEKAKPGVSAAAPSPGQSFGDKLKTGLGWVKVQVRRLQILFLLDYLMENL